MTSFSQTPPPVRGDESRALATFSARSLASGSSGNSLLIQAGPTTLLVDCGISAKLTGKYLASFGVDPKSVDAILLTHEHSDHVGGVGVFSRRHGTQIAGASKTLDAAGDAVGAFSRRDMNLGSTQTFGTCEVTAFPVSHDAASPCGFLIQHAGWAIAVCVDLGRPDKELSEPLRYADLLVIEANHDHDKLKTGPYSPKLKARILSDKGHLSNLEAARIVADSATGRPRTVWLAHLSAENNSPLLARRIVGGFLRRQRIDGVRLEVALRDKPSLAWSTDEAGWQMALPLFAPAATTPA